MKVYRFLFFYTFVTILVFGFFENNSFIRRTEIVWEKDYKLSKNDFKGFPNYFEIIIRNYGAVISTLIKYDIQGVNRDSVLIEAYMNTSNSWIYKKYEDRPDLFIHEMYHFNISELIARNFRKEVNEIKYYSENNIKNLYKKNLKYLLFLQDNYDYYTQNGSDTSKQKVYEQVVDTMLFIYDRYKKPFISKKMYSRNSSLVLLKEFQLVFNNYNEAEFKRMMMEGYGITILTENEINTRLQVVYYKNGQKKSEAKYIYGKLEDKYYSWYETGELKSEIEFETGKRHGISVEYHKNGEKKSEAHYYHGDLYNIIHWNSEGKEI